MQSIEFKRAPLTSEEQEVVTAGFAHVSRERSAPQYHRDELSWVGRSDAGDIVCALTARIIWDWIYIDELWVDLQCRGTGLGRRLMVEAENFAAQEKLVGVWLWTQSWQAGGFYEHLGYKEFTRFADFPRGHQRIGYRKMM